MAIVYCTHEMRTARRKTNEGQRTGARLCTILLSKCPLATPQTLEHQERSRTPSVCRGKGLLKKNDVIGFLEGSAKYMYCTMTPKTAERVL